MNTFNNNKGKFKKYKRNLFIGRTSRAVFWRIVFTVAFCAFDQVKREQTSYLLELYQWMVAILCNKLVHRYLKGRVFCLLSSHWTFTTLGAQQFAATPSLARTHLILVPVKFVLRQTTRNLVTLSMNKLYTMCTCTVLSHMSAEKKYWANNWECKTMERTTGWLFVKVGIQGYKREYVFFC